MPKQNNYQYYKLEEGIPNHFKNKGEKTFSAISDFTKNLVYSPASYGYANLKDEPQKNKSEKYPEKLPVFSKSTREKTTCFLGKIITNPFDYMFFTNDIFSEMVFGVNTGLFSIFLSTMFIFSMVVFVSYIITTAFFVSIGLFKLLLTYINIIITILIWKQLMKHVRKIKYMDYDIKSGCFYSKRFLSVLILCFTLYNILIDIHLLSIVAPFSRMYNEIIGFLGLYNVKI